MEEIGISLAETNTVMSSMKRMRTPVIMQIGDAGALQQQWQFHLIQQKDWLYAAGPPDDDLVFLSCCLYLRHGT